MTQAVLGAFTGKAILYEARFCAQKIILQAFSSLPPRIIAQDFSVYFAVHLQRFLYVLGMLFRHIYIVVIVLNVYFTYNFNFHFRYYSKLIAFIF